MSAMDTTRTDTNIQVVESFSPEETFALGKKLGVM